MVVLVNCRFQGRFSDPLGIEYLGIALCQNRIETIVIDPIAQRFDIEHCANTVAECHPDMVGLSIISIEYRKDAILLINEIRRRLPDCHIVLGGRDPSLSYQEYFNLTDAFDTVSVGEGEISICELADCILHGTNYRDIGGICYRDEVQEKIHFNPMMSKVHDLDKLSHPLHQSAFTYKKWHGLNEVQIIGSRGCYNQCHFCTSPAIDKLYRHKAIRFRSVESIAQEMQFVVEKIGVRHFDFVDDVFFLPGKRGIERTQAFKKVLKELDLKITFNIMIRADAFSKVAIQNLVDVGLNQVYLGIESFDDASLIAYNKNATSQLYHSVFKDLFDMGFGTHYTCKKRIKFGMLTFHAFTTLDGLEKQYEAAIRWGFSPKRLRTKVIPFTGTQLRKIYEENHLIAGTEYKPSFIFADPRIADFFAVWKPFVELVCKYRDSLRDVQKQMDETDALYSKLTSIIDDFDQFGLEVFHQLIDVYKEPHQSKGEAFIAQKTKQCKHAWETSMRGLSNEDRRKLYVAFGFKNGTEVTDIIVKNYNN